MAVLPAVRRLGRWPLPAVRAVTRHKNVRFSLDVSRELDACLVRCAVSLRSTKAEVLRRAIMLMEIAAEGRARGERIVLVDANDNIVTRIAL